MKNEKQNILGREDQEKQEGLETIKKDIPSSRFQSDQQVQSVGDADAAQAPNSTYSKQRVKSKGSVLKQEVASTVVTKGLGGEIPEEASGTYSLSYGGNEGTILGSAAYTPIAGQSRANSRYGKKLDATAKKIDFVHSEQVIEDFDESKPLAQARDAVQGYNGTYKNENARSQKVSGNVPGELMFQRSVDEIKRDQLYFSTGQVVNTTGVASNDTPTMVPIRDARTGVYVYPETQNYHLRRGNFHNRNLHIRVDAQGRVSQFYFDTVDLTCDGVDPAVADQASAHALIDRNYAEMDRQKMDEKAGDEKAELWTDLARAVREPTAINGYLRDIENITGCEPFLAYKKTALAHSYQLTRAAKDGIKTYEPMVEALLGLISPELSSAAFSSTVVATPFSKDYYLKGASSLMIALYDSVSKYNRKSDLLLQPRSFKMHLQTADNNINPLRIKAETVQLINNREVFSTIDRDYDPLMPVCISDNAAFIHCYDFNDLYAFQELDSAGNPVWINASDLTDSPDPETIIRGPFRYSYADIRNQYVVTASCPLLAGVHRYLNSIGAKIKEVCGADTEIVIPMIHSTCFFSLWSLVVLAATPFILNERVNSMRDVLYYEANIEYPYHQLITLKEANPMGAVNYKNTDYLEPIVVGQMAPSAAVTWYMPELFWPFDEETADDTYKYVLPWYFNEESFNFTGNSITLNPYTSVMSMPSIRSGARFSFLDNLYGMEERDLRLCLDRLVNIPVVNQGSGQHGVYKYSQVTDGIPFVTMSKTAFNMRTFLSLPRELGTFIVAPAGYISVRPDKGIGEYADCTDGVFGETSYRIKIWHGRNPVVYEADGKQKILLPTQINVDRASAYVQDWDLYAALMTSSGVNDFGWVPSLGNLFEAGSTSPAFGAGCFVPFTDGVMTNGAEQPLAGGSNHDEYVENYGVVSLQKALWARIQKLPFALSPFDTCCNYRQAGEDAIKVDPFDFLYYFGLAGFRASDYREDIYNRMNEVVNQGFTFLQDPFIKDSPIFKDAVRSTQSANPDSLVKN